MGKLLEDSLGNWSNVLVAVAAVAAVWLLLRDLSIDFNVSKSGFGNPYGTGANTMRFDGQRSDGYADTTTVVSSPQAPVKMGFLGGYEPPVFWNAGSMAAVAQAQSKGMAGEKKDMEMEKMSGFANDYAGRPVYNGFASKPPQGGAFGQVDGVVLTGY